MYDLEDDTLTRTKKGSPVDRMESPEQSDDLAPEHPMDAPAVADRHSLLVSQYRREMEIQSDNRAEMAKDEDYYDHIQFTLEQAKELEDRGQAPVAYDVIHNTINWIIGSEKRGRTDFKILPRTREDAKPAEKKTKYLKYLSDVNHTPFHRSRAFEDETKVGLGWLEVGVQDEDDGEPIYDRYESWRNMLYDSASTELDGSDMRYQFRSKWVDVDIAIALFPDCKDKILESASEASTYGTGAMLDGDEAMDGAEAEREMYGGVNPIYVHSRKRVRLIEGWYRMPANVKKLRGGAFKGDVFNEADPDPRHVEELEAGRATLASKTMMQTRVMIFTTRYALYDDVSPYKHNRFKFVPLWGYRRGRDNLPYGVIRGLRDIQDSINKRASKALYILSTNKVLMEDGILPDDVTPEDFADEISRSDAIIRVRSGMLNRIQLNVDRELAAPHMELMARDINMVQQVGGVTDELMGRNTNAKSGVAIKARQEQGSLATNKLFDNLRFAVQMHGEIMLSLVEQFVTEEKQFRITNMRGTPEFVDMNDGLPENDITRSKADFVISEADWRATMRQAATDQLIEMMGKLPEQVALVMLDLVVESMDVENRDEIVKRIRQINGQRDPDATEITPEEQQAMAAQQEQAAAQKAMFEAELREKNAKAAKAEADTDLTKSKTVESAMTSATLAMEAATMVVTMPTIAKVGDNLLAAGGWSGPTPVPAAMVAQQGIMPPAAAQQPPAQPAPEQMAPPVEPQPQQGAMQ